MPFLKTESIINSRDWNDEAYLPLTLGEVPRWQHKASYNGKWTPPAGLTGKHVCHHEWMETGEPWPVTLPPTVYDDEWIPECCDRAAEGAQGGLELGGAAGDVHLGADAAEGGLEIGGSAGDVYANTVPTEGGIEIGGAAGDVHLGADAAEGGLEIGGAAGDVYANTVPTEGGIEIGGVAGDVWTGGGYADPTEGGVEIGGAAGDVLSVTDQVEGGVEIGGAAGDAWSFQGISIKDTTKGAITSQAGIVLPSRVSGDEILLVLSHSLAATPAANSGWTRVLVGTSTTPSWRSAWYRKTSDGTDSTAPFSDSFPDQAGYIAVTISGTAALWANAQNVGTGTAMTTNSFVAPGAPSIIMSYWATAVASGTPNTVTLPADNGLAAQLTWGTGTGPRGRMYVGYKGRLTTGVATSQSGTLSATDDWQAAQIGNS